MGNKTLATIRQELKDALAKEGQDRSVGWKNACRAAPSLFQEIGNRATEFIDRNSFRCNLPIAIQQIVSGRSFDVEERHQTSIRIPDLRPGDAFAGHHLLKFLLVFIE